MASLIEQVTVPEGARGPWRIERFEISEREARFGNLRALVSGRGSIEPGSYTKLTHERRGIVMSDTPDEMRDHYEAVIQAKGHVLINGLGIGMVLAAVLKRREVTKATVVEIDQHIIDLAGPHYLKDKRVEIVCADAFKYQPPAGIRYGCVWHDIWDELCGDNLPEMTKLKRKYGRRADWQGCWGEHFIRRHSR
jgi:hypothetical protein